MKGWPIVGADNSDLSWDYSNVLLALCDRQSGTVRAKKDPRQGRGTVLGWEHVGPVGGVGVGSRRRQRGREPRLLAFNAA